MSSDIEAIHPRFFQIQLCILNALQFRQNCHETPMVINQNGD